ncbi:PRC-barrel domain-containing protein [Kribbella sp. NPDC059898]|uniref:PRC-barrel domain-containing protein n=1 Tax=Kribbella sp. NPDC059898 TaxID=3346995 RepID=UPI003651D92B
MDDAPGTLINLNETALALAEPADDVRGRKVVDRNGDEVGTIDGLIIDEHQRRVRFMLVGSGGFLGLGEKKQLIPIDAITSVGDDTVRISTERTHVAGGPVYDPEVVPEPHYYEEVYGYWGVPPFWGPGYVYPPFRR